MPCGLGTTTHPFSSLASDVRRRSERGGKAMKKLRGVEKERGLYFGMKTFPDHLLFEFFYCFDIQISLLHLCQALKLNLLGHICTYYPLAVQLMLRALLFIL
jgi:hypothetical protein